MVVLRLPYKNKRLQVPITSGEVTPSLYQEWGPLLSEFKYEFKRYAAKHFRKNHKTPYIFHPATNDFGANFFITEFFDMYPEMKVSMFYFGGFDGIKLENRALYKLLYQLYDHYTKLTEQGQSKEIALEKTFKKFDDYVKVKIQEVGTTQVIANNLEIRPLMGFMQRKALDETRNKLARTKRDVEVLKIRDKIEELEEIDSTVSVMP
jgi:hypothetical protein